MKNVPPGYEIVTDGIFFRHRYIQSGYISCFDYKTKEEAIDFSWDIWKLEQRCKNHVWVKVEID